MTDTEAGQAAGEANAIESLWTAIAGPTGPLAAYVARPSAAGNRPAVLVIHEVYGILGHVDTVCDALARLGYVAIAPMLFARYGDVHALETFDDIHAVSRKVPDAEVQADLDATFAWMCAQPDIDANRIGITGFCWGGRQVWLYAAHNAAVRAGVAWYGGKLVAEPTPLRPRNPIDVVASLTCPVLGLYGGADAIISMESIRSMQAKLRDEAPSSRIIVFDDTPHGFHASNRPSFHPVSAAKGWREMVAWFAEYLHDSSKDRHS